MVKRIVKLINRVNTGYRRINHPQIKCSDLVIDLGSGGMPNPRADIACDAIDADKERADKLSIDRPFVWANLEHLPFKDQAFDYSILSHVLEHLYNPKASLDEIQRISSAGYIETPNSFYEYAIPHTYHVSRCTVINDKLYICFKPRWDDTLDNNYFDVKHDMNKNWWDLHHLDAIALLTIYRWRGNINYEVKGTPNSFVKDIPEGVSKEQHRSLIWRIATAVIYFWLRPRRKIDLQKILACPKCGEKLVLSDSAAVCQKCKTNYPKYKGYYDFRI